MSASDAVLDVRVTRRVHPGLTLDVALQLGREFGVVFGPSGAGKSTLLRLIAGLARPDRGRVRLGDATLFDSEARIDRPLRARGIGMIFQDDLLFPHLSVAGNLRYGLKGQARRAIEDRLAEVAALCGVEALLERRPATLSGGERQRVGLARALAPRPRLLLCDEPVSALDLANRYRLLDRLRAVQRAEAIPVLYVTHSPTEALALGARLIALRDGRIGAEGTALDVLTAAGAIVDDPVEGLRNVFTARIESQAADHGETIVRLPGGPPLTIPFLDRPLGATLTVAVRADDILLARGPVEGLSARNRIAGVVDRLAARAPGSEVEVLVATGEIRWYVSVVSGAVAALGLAPGVAVHLIVKARSCHVLDGGTPTQKD